MAKKEMRQLSRDPRTLAVLVAMPGFILLFYGYVLTFDVHHVKLAVLDEARSAESRALVHAMTSGEYFDVAQYVEDPARIRPILDEGKAAIVLAIPPDFSRKLARREPAPVQAIVDGSNATLAQVSKAYAEGYVSAVGARLAGLRPPPVSPLLRVLYNPDLDSTRFLLPGLMGFILMISSTIATALSVVRERETGTIEQLLVSPLRPSDVVLGKALPYGVLSIVAAVVLLALARFAFGLEIQGNVLLLFLLIVVFVLGAQGLGVLISSITSSQQVAYQTATMATMLPSLLLSGFIFPIRSMPLPIQVLTYLVPARYFVSALRGVVLKGVGLAVIWPQLAALLVFAAGTLVAAILRLRRTRL